MTYKELLKETSSGWHEKGMDWYVETYCPHHLFKDAPMEKCPPGEDPACCHKCWEREVPDNVVKAVWEEITKPAEVKQMNEMDPEKVKRIADAFDKANSYTVSPKELKAALEYAAEHPETTPAGMIKDSGDRTEFSTGAVRDMREGKGRCDLVPMEVMSRFVYGDGSHSDPILDNISHFQNTRATKYLYMAIEEFNRRHWNNRYTACLEVAKHFEEGAKKYGPGNWRRGIPVYCYIDSAVRHYLKWLRGDNDEPHDRAVIWNLMCCVWEVDYHKTMVEAVNDVE